MSVSPMFKDPSTKKSQARGPLLRIMYSSVLQEPMQEPSLKHLLAQCVANNTRDNITGAMMVEGVLCIQYIEGPEVAVRDLWQRISQDARHHFIVQLHEEAGNLPRLFGQWAMLRGQSSRTEMLSLIRNAYLECDSLPRPTWSLAMAPLVILFDPNYRPAYARVSF